MTGHATTELLFDEMPVPAVNIIGEEDQGFHYALLGINAERILISTECIGDSKCFVEKASYYASDRTEFDRPIKRNQGAQIPNASAHS